MPINAAYSGDSGNQRKSAETKVSKRIVNLDDVVDGSFVEAAVKELGPYRR